MEINTRGAAKSAMLGVDIQQPPKADASSTLDLDAELSVQQKYTCNFPHGICAREDRPSGVERAA